MCGWGELGCLFSLTLLSHTAASLAYIRQTPCIFDLSLYWWCWLGHNRSVEPSTQQVQPSSLSSLLDLMLHTPLTTPCTVGNNICGPVGGTGSGNFTYISPLKIGSARVYLERSALDTGTDTNDRTREWARGQCDTACTDDAGHILANRLGGWVVTNIDACMLCSNSLSPFSNLAVALALSTFSLNRSTRTVGFIGLSKRRYMTASWLVALIQRIWAGPSHMRGDKPVSFSSCYLICAYLLEDLFTFHIFQQFK